MLKIKHKVKLVLGISVEIISVAGAIICAIIALQSKGELQEIDQYIETNVNGDNNTININNISDLVREYNNLSDENKSLREQNTKYFNDLMETQNQLDYVSNEMADAPEIVYKDLALMIDAVDKPINSSNAMITIDGRDYVTKEIIEQLIPEDKNMTIKDNTLFVGQVVADKANLFDQWIFDQKGTTEYESSQDSYGNLHSNTVVFMGEDEITYSLDGKYQYANISYAVAWDCESPVIFTIKADDMVVYQNVVNKITEPKNIKIPINNCSLITFTTTEGYSLQYNIILYDCVVYN